MGRFQRQINYRVSDKVAAFPRFFHLSCLLLRHVVTRLTDTFVSQATLPHQMSAQTYPYDSQY